MIAFEVLQNNAKLTQKSDLMKKTPLKGMKTLMHASPAISACDESIKTQVYMATTIK
jgi:hypothetical protein